MKIIFFDVLSRDFQAAFTLLSLVVFFMSIEAVHRLSIAAKTNMGREWFWSLLLQSSGIRKYIYIYMYILNKHIISLPKAIRESSVTEKSQFMDLFEPVAQT